MDRINLKQLKPNDVHQWIAGLGLPDYRAKQLLKWIYEKRISDIAGITEFSMALRERLSQIACIGSIRITARETSEDGTAKLLFTLEDDNTIETVIIPMDGRLALCVSSQCGCSMACKFCLTGRGGLRRSLRSHEIVDQVIKASEIAHPLDIGNIVLMGMGEPLNNIDEVSDALWRLTGQMGFSPRRITVSTSGVAGKLVEFYKKAPEVNLAISLNATTDDVRSQIMPVNKKYPIGQLFDALRAIPLKRRRRITFEYVMLQGMNDTDLDARRLIRLVRGLPSKINLIPFNEFQGCGFKRSLEEQILRFQRILMDAGLTALIRKSKGSDISAACGQLSGKVE